jgi:hypothetical protein
MHLANATNVPPEKPPISEVAAGGPAVISAFGRKFGASEN